MYIYVYISCIHIYIYIIYLYIFGSVQRPDVRCTLPNTSDLTIDLTREAGEEYTK